MKGQLKVALIQRYKNIDLSLFSELQVGDQNFRIKDLKSQKKWWIVSLETLDTRDGAEALRKKPVSLKLQDVQEQVYYLGFILKDKEHNTIGRIVDVIEYDTHKNLIIKTQPKVKIIEVPFVKEWVVKVDENQKYLIMDLPEGLDQL